MRYEPKQPGSQEVVDAPETTEERLRRENEELRRQLQQQQALHPPVPHGAQAALRKPWHPSALTIWVLFLAAIVLTVVAFFAGYLPFLKRQTLILNEAQEQAQTLPRVEVITVQRASHKSELELPGNIQAVTEAPILARADGYIKRRMVDIGDRVQAGQPVAEIEAPELDQQVRQAKATLEQAQSALEQSLANSEQGKANLKLAEVTAQRWTQMQVQGVVSRQDADQYNQQYLAQVAGVQALDKAVAVQRSNIAAAEANLARLSDMQNYAVVKAPFAGVITLRNVDVGALVTTGTTLLYRIAQTDTLRAYVNVPQSNSSSIKVGQLARLSVSNLPGRFFTGTVARTANSLDPASRTLLVDVQVPNPDGSLLPGMYAEVDLNTIQADTPLLVPGDSLIVRADGTQVAVVGRDSIVRLKKVELGRDYGDRLEVVNGLEAGDKIIANPGDARDGLKVTPVDKADSSRPSGPAK
jgi:RND family efflux transporter MFP subunit